MIEQRTLAEVIQHKLPLGSKNPRGFYDVHCAVCNDSKARGGFKFDDDTTGFSCYNCGAKFRYEEGSGKLSKNARDILRAFGIARDDLVEMRSVIFTKPVEEIVSLESLTRLKLTTPEVPLPDKSHPLGYEGFDELQEPLIEYLISRKIDPLKGYFSLDPRFLRRVIIPYWRAGKIIYWQARAVDNGVKHRYLNAPAGRDAVLYGYDKLYAYDPAPLFITEGVFDAEVLDGVCILGSSLNDVKIEVLKRSKRRIIFVIDPDKTGEHLGKVVRDNGWEVSFFDRRGTAGMDANRHVVQFGLPYTIYILLKNATKNPALLSLGVLLGGNFGTYR